MSFIRVCKSVRSAASARISCRSSRRSSILSSSCSTVLYRRSCRSFAAEALQAVHRSPQSSLPVIKDRFLDVRFQRNDCVPSCVGIVYSRDDCPLQSFFFHRSCRAVKVHLSFENSADASPDRGFAASIIPFHPSVDVPAVSGRTPCRKVRTCCCKLCVCRQDSDWLVLQSPL